MVCCKLAHFGSGLQPGDVAIQIKPRTRAWLDASVASGLQVLMPGTAWHMCIEALLEPKNVPGGTDVLGK